jgi:hypothetical protein
MVKRSSLWLLVDPARQREENSTRQGGAVMPRALMQKNNDLHAEADLWLPTDQGTIEGSPARNAAQLGYRKV